MLKKETIIREFKKRGWQWCDQEGGDGYLYFQDYGNRIFGKFNGYLLRLYDARLLYHGNFHLESFWNFTTMNQLREGLDTIEKVYFEVCHLRFREDQR